MESKNRRELALMQVEKARKHLELVFDLLYKEDELEEIEDYYGTIGQELDDLKHEIEWLEKFKPLSLDIEFEGEDPTDSQIDEFISEKIRKTSQMLKSDVRTAQEMFEELGYKKDKDFFPDTPTYTDEYRSLMFTEAGVVIIGKFKQIVSLTTEEMEAVYKQIKELGL